MSDDTLTLAVVQHWHTTVVSLGLTCPVAVSELASTRCPAPALLELLLQLLRLRLLLLLQHCLVQCSAEAGQRRVLHLW